MQRNLEPFIATNSHINLHLFCGLLDFVTSDTFLCQKPNILYNIQAYTLVSSTLHDMTSSEILNIATTVVITQCVCDLIARWLIFSRDPYKRAVENLNRAQVKREKLETNLDTPAKQEKQSKKLQRFQQECSEAASEVARLHMLPKFLTSIVFLILYKILVTEYYGKVVAILPFEPFKILRRLTQRGLDIKEGNNQACSFHFIYILSAMSVKVFANKMVGVHPPKGAEGLLSVLDAPKNQRILKSLGIDPDVLKMS